LTYRGRIDQQVKIDGFRIEPGEIELALLGIEGVREAAVAAVDVPGSGRQLVAYVVAEGDIPDLDAWGRAVRSGLRGRLPDYMSPARFMRLERLPTTPSGKIDRRSLPRPEERAVAASGV